MKKKIVREKWVLMGPLTREGDYYFEVVVLPPKQRHISEE